MTYFIKYWIILVFCMICSLPLLGQRLHFHHLTIEDGLLHNTVEDIAQDSLGFIWLATPEGLCRFDGLRVTSYSASDKKGSPLNNRPSRFYVDPNGALWISFSSTRNLSRYNYATDSFDEVSLPRIPKDIQAVFAKARGYRRNVALSGYRWILQREALYQVDATGHTLSYPQFGSGRERFMFTDRSGVLWIGTADAGVYFADTRIKSFTHHSSALFERQSVRSILVDQDDNLWVGTQDAGLFIKRRNQSDFEAFPLHKGSELKKESLQIRRLFQDQQGNIWIGTRGGLYRYSPSQKSVRHYSVGQKMIPHNWVYAINEDRSGVLWIGTWDGIAYYDVRNDLFSAFSTKGGLPHQAVRAIVPDSDQGIWVATEGGLTRISYRLRDGAPYGWQSVAYTNSLGLQDRLPDSFLYALDTDVKGQLWIGSRRGLVVWDGQGICSGFVQDERLGKGIIRGVVCHNGETWVSHRYGISRVTAEGKIVRHFDTLDGLPFNEFSENASFYNKRSGTLYFGGVNGVIEINPKVLFANGIAPRIAFTGMSVDNSMMSAEEIMDLGISNAALQTADGLVFPSGVKSFSLQFAALDYADPLKNRYGYRMIGIDSTWSFVDAKHAMLSYIGLPAGDYTLEVKAANSDGVWTSEPKIMKIRIPAPWWNTQVAYVLYIVLLLIISCVVILVIKRQVAQAKDSITKPDLRIDVASEGRCPVGVEGVVDEMFLRKAIAVVEEHLAETNFSPDNFARELAISRAQLFRKIKESTGQTVIGFITSIRLSRAAELLKSSSLSIKEIATMTGFSEASNFSRSFSKVYGISPSDFAKKQD